MRSGDVSREMKTLKLIKRKCVCACVCAQSCLTLQIHEIYIARQAPLSMEISKQEYWRGLSLLSIESTIIEIKNVSDGLISRLDMGEQK